MLMAHNRNYRLLFSATAVSNLGDGISALAFPWLASLMTRDPVLIAAVAAAGRLPWLLFAAPAGVITDRASRQKLMVWADILRAILTCGVIGLILSIPEIEAKSTPAHVWALAALAFLLGMAEVLRDNAAQTALPSIVEKADLETANGQLWSVEHIMNSFIGPPIAGLLIALALPLPFAFDALSFSLAAGLVAFIAFPQNTITRIPQTLWQDLREGAVWLYQHGLLFRLAIVLGCLNAIDTAYLTLLVLYSQEVLGLSAFGYGVLTMAGAVGGVLGGISGPTIVKKIGPQRTFLGAQILLMVEPILIGTTSSVIAVGIGIGIAMFGGVTFNVVTVSYRQRVIPDALLGRVNSLYRLLSWGMIPLGAVAGGLLMSVFEPSLGREIALRMPFLVAIVLLGALFVYSLLRIRIPNT